MPLWLPLLARVSIGLACACCIVITIDVVRHRQHMGVMNLVWPITALWAGPMGLWGYFRYGRLSSEQAMMRAKRAGREPPSQRLPTSVHVGKAATHCGSGCTLGDVVAELVILAAPLTLFGHAIFGAWVYDAVFAFVIGIAFQYFTIQPMRNLSPGRGLWAAVKADALSLTAWQLGMYGWMALATFVIFQRELPKSTFVFWFMMQVAMLFGFATSYPVNWWLIRRGIKERM